MELHKKMTDFLRRGKEKASREAAKIEEQIDDLKAKLEKAGEHRKEILELPMSHEELLLTAVAQLAEGKQKASDDLASMVSEVQNHRDRFSNDVFIRGYMMRDIKIWKLFYFIIQPKDIEQAIKSLPPGVPAKERQRRLQEVDEKIAKFESEVEKILS